MVGRTYMNNCIRIFFVVMICTALLGCNGRAKPGATTTDGSQAMTAGEYEDANLYYDFDDILIPSQLDPVEENSHRFEDATFKVSVRSYSGRVVVEDLINFFLNNMKKDNWENVATVKSDKSVLLFRKQNKRCTIQIDDEFTTKVRVFAIAYKGKGGKDMDVSAMQLVQ